MNFKYKVGKPVKFKGKHYTIVTRKRKSGQNFYDLESLSGIIEATENQIKEAKDMFLSST